jgi:O-antigen/teichoic acid export membrane protein
VAERSDFSTMKDLKRLALRGGLAKIVAQAAVFALRIGSMAILARLLDPKDFGLVGMVTVVTGSFGVFKDAGLSVVTVQRPDITEEQISTLFWVNMAVGAVLALVAVTLGPFFVRFYREPRLFWVAVVLGLGFILNAAGVQHSALLQRKMRFDTLAINEIISWVVSIAVGVGLALKGFGYWALVWMAVSLPAAATVGVWLTAAWIPGLPRRRIGMRSMLGLGSTVTANSLIVYAAYNIDKVLIGRLWGAEALGIYGRSYQLINIPTDNLNRAVGGVAVSALSRVQGDPRSLKSYFLKSYSLVLALTLPVTTACALLADDMIVVLLGPKWREVAPIFRLMAPTIIAFAMINPIGWLMSATGRMRRSFMMGLVIAPLVMVGYVAGLPYGAAGVALGYSAMMVILIAPMLVWAIHGTSISFQDVVQTIRPPFVSAIVAAVLTFLVVRLSGSGLSPFMRLITGGGVLTASYLWMLLFVMGQKPFYQGVIRDSRLAMKVAS